jgi:hypothetical protein
LRRCIIIKDDRVILIRVEHLHLSLLDEFDLFVFLTFIQVAFLTYKSVVKLMLEGIEEIVIELSVCLVLGLLGNASLDGGNWLLLIGSQSCCAFGSEIFGEWLAAEGTRLVEGGIETGLADQVVFDCKGKRGYIAAIHQNIIKQTDNNHHPIIPIPIPLHFLIPLEYPPIRYGNNLPILLL